MPYLPYLTPPPTSRKNRGIFEKYKPTKYYEDIYGKMNEEELFDWYPDRCETESEEDDELDTTPSRSKVSQHGSRKRKREVRDIDDGNGEGTTLFVSDDEQEKDNDGTEVRYKIAPGVNPKRSVRIPSMPKMKPKRFGMFGGGDYAKQADQMGGDQGDLFVTDDEQTVPAKGPSKKTMPPMPIIPEESVRRIKRPASRKLLKQQLADRDQARKEALQMERANAAAEEKKAKEAAKVAKVLNKKLYWKDTLLTAKDSKRFEKKKLSPFVDNDGIEFSEYERYGD